MKPVKRVEIVVEALELGNVVKALDRIGVVGYTVIRHVGGVLVERGILPNAIDKKFGTASGI